jgi:hypothetical protein
MFKYCSTLLLCATLFHSLGFAQTFDMRSMAEVNEVSMCLTYLHAHRHARFTIEHDPVLENSLNLWTARLYRLPVAAQSVVASYVLDIEQSILNDLESDTKNTISHIQSMANRCIVALGRPAAYDHEPIN